MIVSRAYNSFFVDASTNTIIKSSETDRLKDEAVYYQNLPMEFQKYFPTFKCYNKNGKTHHLSLEYYPSTNLGELIINQPFSAEKWDSILQSIFLILTEFSKIKYADKNMLDCRQKMFKEKTLKEYINLVAHFDSFKTLGEEKTILLNGKRYLNFLEIWVDIQKLIDTYLMEGWTFSVIHGDFCLANVLMNGAEMKLVDPRGSFGFQSIYGDTCYDLAKLYHSFEGRYEYIINDKFNLKYDVLSFDNDNIELGKTRFLANFTQREVNRLKLIAGLIFVGMCARHYDSLPRQHAMYLTGIRLLNECLT